MKELDNLYYEYFQKYWMPVYKKQVFKAKLTNDRNTLLEIKNDIYKNWHLKKYRKVIVKELGIYHLIVREDLE